MSLSFVIYALAVAALVSAAAVLCELALEAVRWPTRWIWLVATVSTLTISGLGLLPSGPAQGTERMQQFLGQDAQAASEVSMLVPVQVTERAISSWEVARPWLPWGLAALSFIGGAFLLGGWTRLRRGRHGWASARIGETDVRVTDDFGPAVVGVIRPEIVLPRHLLALDAGQLSMVLRHENQHRLARDPALLMVGAGLLCAMPWNPLMWFQFRRLRRAIELDCDARVLGSGVSAARYGRLLVTMQGAPTRYALATMLQEPASFLERRLMMMKQRLQVTRPVRAFALAGMAAILVVAACETPNPTAVQVEPTGEFVVTEVSGSAGQFTAPVDESVIRGAINEIELEDASNLWQYRGRVYEEVPVETDVSAVRGLVPFQHAERGVAVYQLSEASVDGIWKAPEGGVVREGLWLPEGELALKQPFTVERVNGSAAAGELRLRGALDGSVTPLIIVDGVITDGTLADVSSLDIESIELVKGAAAVSVYGERASNGVVVITTKGHAPSGSNEGDAEYEYVAVPSTVEGGVVVRGIPNRAVYEETPAGTIRAVPSTGGGVVRRRDESAATARYDTVEVYDDEVRARGTGRLEVAGEKIKFGEAEVGILTAMPSLALDPAARPLIVIDGVITDLSLSDLPKGGIESLEVVKGTEATALYGSRARNGVVVIQTRQPNRHRF